MLKPVYTYIALAVTLCGTAVAQTTENLDIIWRMGRPDTSTNDWGQAIAGLGDVNGDSYDDAGVVGYSSTLGARVYLYSGGTAFDTIPEWITTDATAGQGTGLSLCGGDINGDGYSDVILEAGGRVYVYYGKNGWPNTVRDLRFHGRLYEDASFVACGDVTGDDTTDLIVSDFWNIGGSGHVLVYKGSAAFDTLPWLRINGRDYEQLGASLNAGGDVNGDGYIDLAVGAATYNVDSRGRVYIYHGGPAMDTIPDWWKDGEGSGQYWGELGCAICPDSDGYARLWWGSMYFPGGYGSPMENGKTEMFFGGIIMDSIPDISIIGADSFSGHGTSYASARLDDGIRSDLICGSFEDSARGMGKAWTSKLRQDTVVNGWLQGRWYRDQLGVNVANAEDVNDDGREEVMFASYADTNRLVVICKYTGPEGVNERPFGASQIAGLKLFQNNPNPFRQFTMINYQLQEDADVSLSVYNVAGQLVRTLVNVRQIIGQHRISWDGKDEQGVKVSGGIYLCRLKANGFNSIRKVVLVK